MTKYCFDTSAFVDSWRRYYRPDTFKSLWQKIGDQIVVGTICVPYEVQKEIGAGNKDSLIAWFKQYHKHVVHISQEQIEMVAEIVNKYPLVSQYKKPRPNHADPFIVAVAKIEGCTVVTYEKKNGSKDHPAIPDLCHEYGVECCSVPDFYVKQGWTFNIT